MISVFRLFVDRFIFFSRQYKNDKNDPFIEQLKQTIEILYKKYVISDDIGIATIHMLQSIENKIKSLFDIIEHMDSSSVMEAEKVIIEQQKGKTYCHQRLVS